MSFPFALPMLLDGGAVSALAGAIPRGVCAERWLCEHPEPLISLQQEYLRAGSQVICAPTAGANAVHLKEYGLQGSVEEINQKLLAASKAAAAGAPTGGTLGPTGLFVPPLGGADFDDIYDCYREQVRALADGGADFLFVESQTSLADMRAAVLAARTANLPVIVSITVDPSGRTLTGGSLLPTIITMQAMDVDAVGLNGSLTPGEMLPILKEVLPHASVPILMKPSAERAGGSLLSPGEFASGVRSLLRAGASIVGGYRGTGPAHIAELKREVDRFAPLYKGAAADYEDADNYAAAIETEAFFLGDDIVFSEPITCSIGLGDDLIDLDDEQVNAALVELHSMDDVMLLTEHCSMTRLPIAIHTESQTILDAALRYFQGRLIIDSACDIDTELIEQINAKYGAILY